MVHFTIKEFIDTSEEVTNAVLLNSKLKSIIAILNTRIKLLQNNQMWMAIEILENERINAKTNSSINKLLNIINDK